MPRRIYRRVDSVSRSCRNSFSFDVDQNFSYNKNSLLKKAGSFLLHPFRRVGNVFSKRKERNRLTSSILTFVMLFQTIAGVFVPVNIFNLKESSYANAGWFAAGWEYRKEITIDRTKVAGDLAYFPMLVSLTDSSLKTVANGGRVNSDQGYDIIFTNLSGSMQLDHEIEKYVPTTGEIVMWVKIPLLSASEDTSIYIYYGNSGIAASQENKAGVWDDGGANNFRMVQHMNEDPSGAAPQMLNSATNILEGTSGGSILSENLINGKINRAVVFDGVDDRIALLDTTIGSVQTISAWLRTDPSNEGAAVSFSGSGLIGYYAYTHYITPTTFNFQIGAGGTCNSIWSINHNVDITQWHLWTYERNDTAVNLYVDGNYVGSKNIISCGSTVLNGIGVRANVGPVYKYFKGTIDEVRVSNIIRSAEWIATEYQNQSNPPEFYSLGIEEVYNAPALSSFGYRKAITIDHTKVAGDLTDFPLLVSLPIDASLASHAQGDGDDILFASSAVSWNTGTANDKLAHEIEGYNSVTGELQTWVRVPNLSSSVDTVIYMYYGNNSIASQQNKAVVWGKEAKMVQHMNQDPSGAAPQLLDSSLYGHDGTSGGTMTGDDLVAGKIGQAQSLDGTDDYFDIGSGSDLDITDAITASAWFYTETVPPAYYSLVGEYYSATNGSYELYLGGSSQVIWATALSPNTRIRTTASQSFLGAWHYAVSTFSYTDQKQVIYIDGVQKTEQARTTPLELSTRPLKIGGGPYSVGYLNGMIDEVRIASTARSAEWIATEYNNQSNPLTFYALGVEEIAGAPALSSFGYRKAITIDHSKVSADLSDFPVLISLPTDASLASYAQADADDILFTSSDISWSTGTANDKLAYEIESYNSTTGSLQAWVKIPQLSSTSDTVIYMYYGNATASSAQSKFDVWNEGGANNFKMVQHMNQNPSASAPQLLDSTGYGNNGTSYGTMTSGNLTSGQIDGAISFDGINDYFDVGNGEVFDLANNFNICTWAKWNNYGADKAIVSKYNAYKMDTNSSGYLRFTTLGVLDYTSAFLPTIGSWYHICVNFDSANDAEFFINGNSYGTVLGTNPANVSSNPLRIGSYSSYFSGLLDEVRVSNAVRSVEWIATEYSNQSNPTEFYSIGIEEAYNAPALSSFGYRKAITIDHTKVSGNLTNFPVLINLPTDTNLVSRAQADGDDILFTLNNITWNAGTINDKLAHEIEKYDPATGELVAWIKIPDLSSSVDTVIYMYYGNGSVSSQQNKTVVWDSNTKLVQHMNEDPSGIAPQMRDSTQYGNNGTSYGSMTGDDWVAGQIGKAIDFDGVNDYIRMPDNLNLTPSNAVTLEAWTKPNGVQADHARIIDKSYNLSYSLNVTNTNKLEFQLNLGGVVQGFISTGTFNPDVFNHVVAIYDGSTIKFYINGNPAGNLTPATNGIIGITTFGVSIAANTGSGNLFAGVHDEVRISNVSRSASWIATEYRNQSDPTEFYSLGIEEASGAPALSSFGYRRTVIIDHTKVSGDLTDFPVLINLPADTGLASHAQADADDILFTLSDTTWTIGTTNDKLAHEIEKYDSATGELVAWVRVPDLSSTEDTTIYMYYGNSSTSSQQNKTVVWDSNTKMVQHMNEDPSGIAPQMKDSTQYGNHGTSAGAMTSNDLVAGPVDGATDFDGVDDYMDCGNRSSLDMNDEITISAWIKYSSVASGGILGKGNPLNYYFGTGSTGARLRFRHGTTNFDSTVLHGYTAGIWHNVVVTVNQSTNKIKFYSDGIQLGADVDFNHLLMPDDDSASIGVIAAYLDKFNGSIDEVRISSTARSAEWIATEYANQSAPSAFYALESEQIYGLQITGNGNQTSGQTQTLALAAKDAAGNTMIGFSGDISVTFSGASASPRGTSPSCNHVAFGSPTTLTFTNGVATCTLRLYKAENASITASGISTTANALAVSVIPNLLNNFLVDTPATSNSGESFSATITARDYEYNPVSISGDTSLSVSTGNILPAAIPSSSFTNGVWSGNLTVSDVVEQPSVTVTATKSSYTGTDSIIILGIPQSPQSASASRNSDYSMTLTWQDVSTVETGYKIERRMDSGSGFGSYREIGTVGANTAVFTDDASSNPADTPIPDRAYQYRVRAYNSIGNCISYSEDATIQYTTPNTPSNIASAYVDDNSFTLSYTDNAAVEDTHRIQRCSNTNCAVTYETDLNTFESSPQTDSTSIYPDSRYRWQARSETPTNVNSAYAQSNYEYTTPTAPTIGNIAVISSTEITVNWTDNSAYEDGFRVEVSTDGGAYQEITPGTNTVGANISSYSYSSSGDHSYKFRVRSHIGATTTNSELLSAYSGESSQVYTDAAAPSIGTPAVDSSTAITWHWTDNSAFEEYFHLDFVTGSGTDVDDIPADSTSYQTTSLSPNTAHSVHIHSYRSDTGESEASETSSEVYTLANVPSGLSATADGQEQITATWSANSNPAGTEYLIENMNTGTDSGWITDTSWASTGLVCGVEYSFRVKARNFSAVETSYSAIEVKKTESCGGGAILANPPKAPEKNQENPEGQFKVVINQGQEYTNRAVVSLRLYGGPDTVRMAISNTPDFKYASVVPYQEEIDWDIVQNSGIELQEESNYTRTVYVKFYTKYGASSSVISDSITFDTAPPEIEVAHIKQIYKESEEIRIGGRSEAYSKLIFNLDSRAFGIVHIESGGIWNINLGKLSAGDHNLKLIAQDKIGNSSDTMEIFFKVEKDKIEIPNIPSPESPDSPKDSTGFQSPEEGNPETPGENVPREMDEDPEESSQDQPPKESGREFSETPSSMKGEWNLVALKPFAKDFTQQDIAMIIEKFPQLKDSLGKLGIRDFSDPEKINNVRFTLPSLSEIAGISPLSNDYVSNLPDVNIPLTELSANFKKEIPSNIVFIKSKDSNFDINSVISFQDGISSQKASLLSGKSFQLILRPDQEVNSIKGYLTFKGDKSALKTEENIFSKLSFLLRPYVAYAEEEVEEKLVLSEFDYEDYDGDGIWTAEFYAPQVAGEYEMINVLDYKEIKSGSKTIRLITVVDPEGYVYRKDIDGFETHIPNATVSLYWFNPDTRAYELWDANKYQQTNPQTTGTRGTYSFLVPPGSYYLKAEAAGHTKYQSDPFDVVVGSGVHMNIELQRQADWREQITWQNMLLAVFGIGLFYNFYSDQKERRRRRRKETRE